jgi:hypothetical protein
MALFDTDSIALCCANVQLEKQWWIGATAKRRVCLWIGIVLFRPMLR